MLHTQVAQDLVTTKLPRGLQVLGIGIMRADDQNATTENGNMPRQY
jgi:hypothetical protein